MIAAGWGPGGRSRRIAVLRERHCGDSASSGLRTRMSSEMLPTPSCLFVQRTHFLRQFSLLLHPIAGSYSIAVGPLWGRARVPDGMRLAGGGCCAPGSPGTSGGEAWRRCCLCPRGPQTTASPSPGSFTSKRKEDLPMNIAWDHFPAPQIKQTTEYNFYKSKQGLPWRVPLAEACGHISL